MRSEANGTNSQPIWIFPLLNWEEEGAGRQTGLHMIVDGVSAIDVGYPQRLFYLLSANDDAANESFRLAAFDAVSGKTVFTPFPNGGYVVGGSFAYAPSASAIVSLVGVGGNGSAIELGAWSTKGVSTGGGYRTVFAFPTGYMNAFNYGLGFVSSGGAGNACV
jgi:hypothetical protein